MNVVPSGRRRRARRPAAIGAITRCLNSGAVNRSTSPVTATTWVSPPTGGPRSRTRWPWLKFVPARRRFLIRLRRRPAGRAGTRARRRAGCRARRRAARSRCRRPGTAASTTSASPPPPRSGPTRSSSERALDSSSTSTVSSHHVRGRAGGDEVGDQHGVVEPVEREVGARGEHADDPAEDGADQRPGGDRDARRRLGRAHARPSCAGGRVAQEGHDEPAAGGAVLLDVAASRRARRSAGARARARRVGAGPDPAAGVGHDHLERARPRGARPRRSSRPSSVYAWRTTFVQASVTASRMSSMTARRQRERLAERAEDVPDHRDVLGACG